MVADVRRSGGLCHIAALTISACIFAAPILCPSGAVGQEPTLGAHLVVLDSAQSLLPAGEAIRRGFSSALQASALDRATIFSEYLDDDRFPGRQHQANAFRFLQEKYAATHIDLVLAMGPAAFRFLTNNRASLFSEAPIVFVGIGEDDLRGWTMPPNATGIISRFDPVATVDLALALQPDATSLVVVTGSAAFDQEWEQVARSKLKPFERRLSVSYLSGLPMKELLLRVGGLPQRTIILYLSVFEDGAGDKFIPRDVAEKIAAAASAPVYGVYGTYLGRGIVGGYIADFEAMGAEAGRMAVRVLAGEKPAAVASSAPGISFFSVDWRQLQRWGLSDSSLPAGTTIRYREPSLWAHYWRHIVALIVTLLVQTVLIVSLLIQRRRRRRAELEAAESRRELAHLMRVAVLGELSGALAHELNQPLTAILSNAQAAQRLLAKAPVDLDELREILSDIRDDDKRAGDVVSRLRALMKKGDTRILPLNLNDLTNDVLELAHSELVERNIAVTTRLSSGLPDIQGDRVQLQQVLLNLVMNACEAMAGSNAADSSLDISTARDENDSLRLTVSDHGPGVPIDQVSRIFEPFITTKSQGLGLGLSICRSIVSAHGGRLWVVNNPDRGASFFVSLPIHARGHTFLADNAPRIP
jgi:signal transduction histidine kinase